MVCIRKESLQFLPKDLPQLFHLWTDHKTAVTVTAVRAIIILMIVLGRVELGEGGDLCDDRSQEGPRFVQLGFVVPGQLLLFVVVIENRRAVLGPFVIALPV